MPTIAREKRKQLLARKALKKPLSITELADRTGLEGRAIRQIAPELVTDGVLVLHEGRPVKYSRAA